MSLDIKISPSALAGEAQYGVIDSDERVRGLLGRFSAMMFEGSGDVVVESKYAVLGDADILHGEHRLSDGRIVDSTHGIGIDLCAGDDETGMAVEFLSRTELPSFSVEGGDAETFEALTFAGGVEDFDDLSEAGYHI